MANSDKNIIITPNIGSGSEPSISLVGAGNSSLTLKALDDVGGKLSFQGSAGNQIFGLDTNFIGLGQENSNIFSINDSAGLTLLGTNNNFNTTVDLCPGDGQVRVHGHNYIVSACLSLTASSITTIVNNNDGYVEFELSSGRYFISDPDVIQLVTGTSPYGLRFTKSGIVHFNISQDIIVSDSTNYTQYGFYVNGTVYGWHLITRTNGQWDGFVCSQSLKVKAGDIITLRLLNGDITNIDRGDWSFYNILFHAIDW